MKKLIAILLIGTLGLIAEETKNKDETIQHKSVKEDKNSFLSAISSLFDVKDPDKVDNKGSLDKLFIERK